jgi:protein TonB
MSQRVDIFDIREPWKGPVSASIAFHGAIVALVFVYGAVIGFSHHEWGGTQNGIGDSINVSLAGPSAIPLPHEQQTDNIVAHQTPGMAQSMPKEIPKPQPEAVPIPETTKIKPREKPHESAERHPQPVVTPPNQVQYGNPQIRQNFTTFNTATGVGALAITTGGDFGSRYSFYVRQVTQILSQNWLKYEVDPHAMPNATVSISFEISRNGQPSNVKITQSSGIPSLDTSAMRTLERIDTFGPLPSDYRGSSVTAEYDFKYTPIRR